MRVVAVAARRAASARPLQRSTWRSCPHRPDTAPCCGTSIPRERRRTATGPAPGSRAERPGCSAANATWTPTCATPTTSGSTCCRPTRRSRVVDTILSTRRWPDRVLRKLLRPLDGKYDVVILDCAPGLGVVTESVIAASDLLLAPIIPAPLAVRSLDQLEEFTHSHRPGMPFLAFLSMLDERKVLHRQVVAQVRGDRRFALAPCRPRPRSSAWAWSRSRPCSRRRTTSRRSRTGGCGPRSRTDSTWSRASPTTRSSTPALLL